MYDPNVNLTNHIADLNQKWSENLRKSKDKLDLGKLNELHQETVNLVLDFRLAIQPENIEEMLNELTKLKKILIECSSRFSDLNMDESFETIHTLEKWDSSATAALLSGKIVARSSKFSSNFEKKLLNEADNIINARLESLIILFQSTKCTDTSQMIVNCLETYKKLLIAEPCLQNKFTCKTVENLITMLLIVTCHRREFDHLKSLIKFFPHHRKIQFILNKLKNCEEQVTKIHQNKIFICICIAQDLLKSEYEKPLQEQNLKNYNLYVNLIVDLAMQDKFANDELRKVLLSAVSYDMNVLSSFYYLTADVLRFKMPGIHDILIIELFSIGLSHDLSYLEEIKYNNIKDTNYLNQEFICTNKRMFMALTTLGSIVKDYNLQRLCFQAASVCESETKFSKTILELLPENVRLVPPKVEDKNEEMERTLMNLKEQLETFQCAIKTDFNIANSWEKSSLLCYENLDFLNHRIRLSEDLKPLVYAGVERYMKRPRLESSEETDGEVDKKKSLEVEKILTENQFFTNKISECFKSIKYLNNDSENQSVLLPSEVKAFIIKTFSQCSDFDIDKRGEIFMKFLSDVSLENLRNYRLHWFTINENQQKLNEKNLFFDFDMTPKLNETCDVKKMYQSGNVRVYDLCNDNCNIFDIENVMFYAIMEKKSLYIPSEFVLFNRNESYKTTKCQTQAAFNFLMFKQNPEGRRLSRIVNTAYKSSGMFEFCLETYLFDCESGRYKYVRRNENEISTGDVETFSSQNEAVEHLKKPQSSSKPKGGYPTITTTDTSHGSDDFINVFLLLQNELSNIAGEKIKLDINFFCDESSQHKIDFTQCTSTTLPITINKVRNTLKVPSIRIEKEIPATIHGSVVVHQVFRDNIVYDENNDNPKLVITSETTLSGTIVLNYMSHNLKNLEIKCDVNGVKSQIKCSLRSGMRGMKTSSASKAIADDSMKDSTTNFEPSPKKIKIECREILANFLNSKQNENHSVQERQQLSDVISNYHQQPQQTSDTSTYQNGVHHENYQENQTTIQNLSSSSNYLQYLDIYDVVKKENYSPGYPPTTQVSYQHQQQFSNPLFQNGCQSSVIVGNGGDGVDLLTSPPPLVSNNNVINMEKVKILSNDLVSPPKKPSFSKPIEEILESNSILHVANSVSENIAISSINDVENKMLLDDIKSEMNSSISTEIDFEDEITPKFIPFSKPRIEECMRVMKDELPSKSPPPLHYPPSAVVLKDEKISKNGFDMEKKRVDELDCFDDDDDDDNDDDDDVVMEIESSRETIVIDLTDEFDNNDDPLKIPRRKPGPKSAHRRQRLSDIQSSLNLSSYNNMMPSTELEISDEDFNTDFNRVLKKFEKKVSIENSSLKRPRLLSNDSITNRLSMAKSEVRLFDVMEQMKQHEPKVNMNIKINQVKMKLPSNIKPIKPNRRDFQIQNITLEQPYEDSSEFVSNFNQSTFHIVYQNCVSYAFDHNSGDTIANNLLLTKTDNDDHDCSVKIHKFSNTFTNQKKAESKTFKSLFVDNIANIKLLNSFAKHYLVKSFNSDSNRSNFTKNLKNCKKKFCHWMPKVSNDALVNDKLRSEEKLKDNSNDDDFSLFVPGLNSLEFFQLPPTPMRRSLHVKVIHILKDAKNGNSSTPEKSDTDNNQQQIEAKKLSLETSNGECSTHVQKIGQTTINRESDAKTTIQTSFGSIIKNTYPPATLSNRPGSSLDDNNSRTSHDKRTKIEENVRTTNVKIVACNSQSDVIHNKNSSRNQTLINMLTQQVMLPTNTNRHFIITSNKTSETSSRQPISSDVVTTPSTTSTASSQNIVKVVASHGQSQLVQILNSPPSNFTMKATNTTVTSSQTRPTNQVVTLSPQLNNANNNNNSTNIFKTEVPSSVKQQGIVQFICKTDGKIIHLTPICSNSGSGGSGTSKKITYKVDTSGAKGPTILHHANQQIIINNQLKKSDNQNILTIIQKQQDDGDQKRNKSPHLSVTQTSSSTPTSPINTRSIYEETYAKFIQTSSSSSSSSSGVSNNKSTSDMGLLTISSSPATPTSIIQKIGKTVIQSSNQVLPKFNQAFGKTVFTTNSSLVNEQLKNKIMGQKEVKSEAKTAVGTKVTRTVSEIKSTDAGALLSLLESENNVEKSPMSTLQTAMQSNLLYARAIGNGKLLTSSNSNVLLTALRGNNPSGNIRIITTMPETSSDRSVMAPMRISVPIQIPKLINTSVRPQVSGGNFRQQIVIATTPTRLQQSSGSKLESLLMSSSNLKQQETEVDQQSTKIEQKPKKNVDHSTLEQLREFDMVLEQVLERSSSEATSVSPPTPESPKKTITTEGKIKTEIKLNSVTITSISPSVSPSLKTSTGGGSAGKVAPKVQEDEHTAQRILDILANYKEQVRNSPDLNNKPAPRRRANPPTNPPVAKRKKVIASGSSSSNMKSSKQFGSTSDMMTDTMGSEEDSSCGMGSGVASTGSMNNSPQAHDIDDQTDVSLDNNFYMEDMKRETALSPQSSSSSVATSPSHSKFPVSRRLILTEAKVGSGIEMSSTCQNQNIIVTKPSQSSSSNERFPSQATVLMPGNYLVPMNVLKGGQQLAILSSNNGQKIIAVPTNQLTSSVVGNQTGTSIILQRYLSQSNDSRNRTILTSSNDVSQNAAFKTIRMQSEGSGSVNRSNNSSDSSTNTFCLRPIQTLTQQCNDGTKSTFTSCQSNLVTVKQEEDTNDSQNSKFVSDKTLITEIIQQQQKLSTHQHPQQNFMIKLNEHQPSDPRSSSSIMFVPNTSDDEVTVKENFDETPEIKIEEMDYDDYMKEDVIDLLNDADAMSKSPMLNMKIEVDDNTNSNHDESGGIGNIYGNDSDVGKIENEKFKKFQIAMHGKISDANVVGGRNIKGYLIDPSNKIVMCNDRKPATIEKEFFNQKSFSEECADLGVDEPIASDLFPEADLLFESGSPKFDQINSHDGAMHIKKELENGQVLLEMNYNHNMETESWLNFDTEEELVDESQI